jgi:hypothetical protein
MEREGVGQLGAASIGRLAKPSPHTTNTERRGWQPGSGDFGRFSCQRLNLLEFGWFRTPREC